MYNKTFLIFTVVAGLFMLVFYLAKIRVRNQRKEKQITGIKLNLLLKTILLSIQKQRGLCALYTAVDSALQALIEGCIKENEKLIDTAEYRYSDFLNDDPRWRSIRIDWSLLRNNIFTLDRENILIYHNLLIENIIYMMENVAHKGQDSIENIIDNDEIKAIWHNIPQTLEAIGKTRVIGSGVAFEGVCSRVNKTKLKYLSNEISKNYKCMSNRLGQLSLDEMNEMPSQVAQRIDRLLIIVHDKLIAPEIPEVEAGAFFNEATQTMDDVAQLFDALSGIKEQQIRRRVKKEQARSSLH